MRTKIILLATVGLTAFVVVACVLSEVSWTNRVATSDSLRQLVGLPSLAVGNLNPAARNPGLELFCTGFLDVPGGYCYYFNNGVAFVNFTQDFNITVSDGS